METWKRNLLVCWFSVFFVSSGGSQIAPVLPLYIQQLGVQGPADIAQWSGLIFGINYITLAIFSPIWGKAADRYGRKPMLLRASLWMFVVLALMAYAQNVYQLLILRFLQGALAGFVSAATTLVATQTPDRRAGWALGTLSTGQVAGTLMGPLIGGFLAETFGGRGVFLSISGFCLLAFGLTYIFVEEKFIVPDIHRPTLRKSWRLIPNRDLLMAMFVTTFVIQLTLMSIQPIITLYVTYLSDDKTHVALISGAVFAAAGVASVLSGSRLGKLSDKFGPQKVMLILLIIAGILYIPQAFVKNPYQLGVIRFLLGIATAGLLPAVNTLIKCNSPNEFVGQSFGYNQSAQHIGAFVGSILGGQVAAVFGIKYVFFLTGALLLANAIWVYKKIYRQVQETYSFWNANVK